MKKGKKTMLFAGIGVAVIAVAVVLILVLGGGHRVIKVDDFEGEVTFERNSEEKEIAEGINLKSEDIITTGEDGLVELLVDSDKHILAKENTSFEIISKGNEKKGKLVIKLNYGTSLVEIENKLNDKSFVEVETPNTSLSVRGTTFEISYSKENKVTQVEVTDGVVEITCGDETKKVKEGQIATVTDEGAVVVHKDFLYNEVPVFKVGYMESGEFSDVYVKQLTEWQYEPGEVSGIDM
ncbi:MAG: FecR domain-containing protein, partial [Lachnospiraceae bacterium]|nr:FecR domain-containing protein [Lachnospiraceae bacterium]